MNIKISLRATLLIVMMLLMLVKTVTSNNQKKVEVVEDYMLTPEENIGVSNPVDNYHKGIINENKNIINNEGSITNESELCNSTSDECVRELENPIYSGLFGTSSWKLFSDGTLYIGAGKFPKYWSDPPGWSTKSPENVIIEGPILIGERVSVGINVGIFNMKSIESITGLTYLNTSNVVDMSYMFSMTQINELDVSGFDTSNVTNMNLMFYEMSQLGELDVSGFDTSNVTNMGFMFSGLSQLRKLDISGIDTSNVTNMLGMFYEMSQLRELDISGFDTSNVTSMGFMFNGMEQLKELDVSAFDTSSLADMGFMFSGMNQIRILVLGTKSIFDGSTRLPESVSEGYWLDGKSGTIFNSSRDFMGNYTGEFPGVYAREQEFLFRFSDVEENAVATITGYIGSKIEIEIPSIAINYSMGWTREIPIIAVGDYAFYEKKITGVEFPESINRIGKKAFARNIIEIVNFPEELISIDESAFQLNNFIDLHIPDKVYEIGSKAFADNNLLSHVILGDGIEKIGSGVFTSAPLKKIEVSEEHLEKYQVLLNSDVMIAAVAELPVLHVGEDRYIDGKSSEINIDYGDALELGIISKKRYQMGGMYVWNTFMPSVQWYKNKQALADEVNSKFAINQVREEDSGNYHAVVEETILEPIIVKVFPMINHNIPSIDPTDPNPIFPDNPNPTIEALSLRFVSDLKFNEINVSNLEQIIFSKSNIDMNGQAISNMVTVQDLRTEEKRDSWNLTVKQSGELMNGGRIIMNPFSHSENKENFGIMIFNSKLVINSESQSFAGAYNSKNGGIFSIGMHKPEGQGVQLEVPKNPAVGEYSTTLIWNLVSGP